MILLVKYDYGGSWIRSNVMGNGGISRRYRILLRRGRVLEESRSAIFVINYCCVEVSYDIACLNGDNML